MHDKIFLAGFRATGKTTIGRELASALSWEFIDMDEEIVKCAGMTIAELTGGGKNWQEFRQMEQDVLTELLHGKNIVVAMGGGAPVNNIIKEGTRVEFGRRNADMLIAEPTALIVLLTADDQLIHDRMKKDEMEKPEVSRPILDEKKAREMEQKLEEYQNDPIKRKEIIVEEILKDSMSMYEIRKPLYEALTDVIVDTGKLGPKEAAAEIIKQL